MASITINDLRKNPNETYFGDLIIGDVFERYGEYSTLIKIEEAEGYNAVYLSDGTLGCIGDTELVTPLDAELCIRDCKEN